jgi:hypothetical protein
MVFAGALLMIVIFGVGGAEFVRFQCRRMLGGPARPRTSRVRTAPAHRAVRGAGRPPVRTAPVPAGPQTA